MDGRSKGRLITIVVLGVVIVGIGAWHLDAARETTTATSATGDDHERHALLPTAVAGGLQPRSFDPAETPLEWVRDGVGVAIPNHPPHLETLITDERDLEALMELLQWSLPTGQGGDSGIEMAKCAAHYEPELEERCAWDTVAILRRQDAHTGHLVYARAEMTAGGHQAPCRAMAACSSKAWAGRDPVPMPATVGDELAFTQPGRGSLWHPQRGTEPIEHYRAEATRLAGELRAMENAAHGPSEVGPSSLGWNSLFLQHRIDEYECMVDVLERRENPCRR